MRDVWLDPAYCDPATKPFFDERGMLNVFSREDVRRVFSDTEHFGVTPLYEESRYTNLTFGGMWAFDGELHDQHKGLLKNPFAGAEPLVRAIVSQQFSGVGNSFDSVPIAFQISGGVICAIVGLDKAMIPQFVTWLQEQVEVSSTVQMPGQPPAESYLRGLLEEHRERPQRTLIDDVIAAAPDNFSEWDILSYIWIFVAAGLETTATGIANMLVLLAEHEGCWQMLRRDPTLIPLAVEECLRVRPSFPSVFRAVLAPCQLGGYDLTPGMCVRAWVSAAHGGKSSFDITRKSNPHYAFGSGVHACYGSSLARLEMRVVLESLLDTFSTLYLIEPVTYHTGVVVGPAKAVFQGEV